MLSSTPAYLSFTKVGRSGTGAGISYLDTFFCIAQILNVGRMCFSNSFRSVLGGQSSGGVVVWLAFYYKLIFLDGVRPLYINLEEPNRLRVNFSFD